MAVPTVPTVNSILTEAFRRCGVPSPTVAQLTRAEDEWFEEVKQELQAEKRWHKRHPVQRYYASQSRPPKLWCWAPNSGDR